MAGRHTKFQDEKIWREIIELLRLHDKAYFIAIGVQGNEPQFLQDIITADIQQRLLFFPYRKDYLSIMGVADVLIDTYPSGGGQILFDAMSLKLPIVSFEHDYSKPYDQAASWSVMGEYAASGNLTPELLPLVVKRDDFAQFKEILNKLVLDETYRKQCGEMAFQCFQTVFNKPQRMTQNCEKIYVDLFNKKVGNFT
jgi:glycosyltransferase involved in cell wall biosynthesis